jgi:hypothetical protein
MNPRPGRDAEFITSTNAIKLVLGAVLLKKDLTNNLRPCAYFAKVLQPARTNYRTYDQELLGVVCASNNGVVTYVEGIAKIAIITDHATLHHLPTQESLGRRHAIWLNDLSSYLAINPRTNEPIMEILYRKGPLNEADALSRRPELHHTIATAEQRLRRHARNFVLHVSLTSE